MPIGQGRAYPGDGYENLTLVTFGNGVPMSLRVARRLAADCIRARVFDLRWLAPLPACNLAEASRTGRVLVVDETRRSGGVSEAIITALIDAWAIRAESRGWPPPTPSSRSATPPTWSLSANRRSRPPRGAWCREPGPGVTIDWKPGSCRQ